jgi:Xaa-Pro aminopeptidase
LIEQASVNAFCFPPMSIRYLLFTLTLGSTALSAQEGQGLRLDDDAHGIHDNDLLSAEFHRGRREALRELMPDGGVAVLFANPVRNRSNDVDFEYHQDPDLYYLSGLREPDAVLLLFKEPRSINGTSTTELLVVRARDPKREVWDGHRLGSEGAKAVLGLKYTMTGEEFLAMGTPFRSGDKVFLHLAEENLRNDPHASADLADLIDHVEAKTPGTDLQDPGGLEDMLAYMREIKLPEELALMRKAIDITCEAQMELMWKLEPDMTEYQTEAIIEYVFKVNGAEHEGFPSIQGGGPHSCVLHYVTNRRTLGDGDLLVSDVGAEYHGYTADVTRTIPANGRFTPDQRKIYDLVLAAQEAGIAEVHPGRSFQGPHRAATAVIAKGLVELGIIKDESEVRRYFMHGTSHYLGLDVHDAGTYGPLRTGSVITVEPGIYIAKDSPCDPRWWGIGVRIEDDILVTAEGPVNLSVAAPRKAEEIEALMQKE